MILGLHVTRAQPSVSYKRCSPLKPYLSIISSFRGPPRRSSPAPNKPAQPISSQPRSSLPKPPVPPLAPPALGHRISPAAADPPTAAPPPLCAFLRALRRPGLLVPKRHRRPGSQLALPHRLDLHSCARPLVTFAGHRSRIDQRRPRVVGRGSLRPSPYGAPSCRAEAPCCMRPHLLDSLRLAPPCSAASLLAAPSLPALGEHAGYHAPIEIASA
ncbi:hypothetical protein PVAP13_2KG118332 [Panicum virgatum]|uniref:Uncharacterized protein n=1 Tax=Panicum virgatum TaxID=38727 RepID=A0A8T0W2B3_PANVG|nr:hypothetical protein PVAP13_2KG118332 [Panicum virgatum]